MTEKERLFKVLGENGEAFHGGRGKWPLPTKNPDGTWAPGEWMEVEGELEPCTNGLHLCREADLVHWLGPAIWEAEYEGERVDCDNKIVVRRARLLRQCEAWNERTARLFACDCAEEALSLVDSPDPRSVEAIAVARQHANGKATDEELAAARAAAWDAAWDAARDAAWDAAWAAAGDAARAAAWEWQTGRLMEYLFPA